MTQLTQDELTVLLIAAEGESMMSIGRWEKPIESLIAKGYLYPGDKFNNFITDMGRAAAEAQDNANIKDLIDTNNAVVTAQDRIRARAEEIANLLAELAAYSSAATGGHKQVELNKWGRIVLVRAKELLK